MCEVPRNGKLGHLDINHLKRMIDSSKNVKSIAISGGEPLLHPNIFEFIEYAHSKGIDTYMPSNGVLITGQIASRLKIAGIRTVNISIEGPKSIHDALRGDGNYDKALRGLKNLREQDIECTLAMTIMKPNFEYMHYVMELALAYGVTTVKFQPFNNDFVYDKLKINKFHLTKKEIPELIKEIDLVIFLSKKYKIQINPIEYMKKMPEYFLNKGTFKVKTCMVPSFSASISEDGNVYPCWPLAKYGPVGNISKENFDEIWNSQKYKKARQKASKGICPGCLMSCHDSNMSSISKIKRNVLKDNIIKQLSIIKRNIKWKIVKNKPQKNIKISGENKEILDEINLMKKELKKKIKKLS